MTSFWQDLRYGLRMLIKQPWFTFVSALTLALGIGANTAIFSVVNTVLLRPLQYKESEHLMKLYESLPQGGEGSVSVPNLNDWRRQNDVFEDISAYQFGNFSLQGAEHPERVSGAYATANFFAVMGVPAALGRTFQEGEDRAGNNRVVVLSDQLWRRNFAADPDIIGRDIPIGGENFSVIGVMPPSFRFPSRLTELWVPLVFTNNQLSNRGNHAFATIGRLKQGVTVEQAREQMSAIASRIEQQYPNEQTGRGIRVIPLEEEVVQGVRPALLVLLGAVSFVLLIACTNVANLLLARATARRKEIAIRTALGAGRWRLVRQFLTESLLLALLGGAMGLAIGSWGLKGLVALAYNFLPRATEINLDTRVLLFTLALSVITGVAFGLAPALQISRTDVQEVLKTGGAAGSTSRRSLLRSLLVVAEVAAAVVLLIGSGLLIKSFMRLQEIDSGIKTENVLTVRVALPEARYPTPQKAAGFYGQVLERVSTLPGVQAAGLVNMLPIQQAGFNGGVQIEGQATLPPEQMPLVEYRAASPEYFRALAIPLVAGRFFSEQDHSASEPVVIVNQAFVRQLLPDQNPIGVRINTGVSDWVTIVGVVGDVKQVGLTYAPRAEAILPYAQATTTSLTQSMTLVVRAASDPAPLVASIRNQVQEVDPSQPIYNAMTMQEVIATSISYPRLNMILLTVFAALALALALIGIYSVMSYTVTQNTREIGIRMALGAQAADVLRLIVGQGLVLTLAGVGIGAAGAFLLTRLMASLLYGVEATDPATFLSVVGLLIVVAALACYVPARRATRVDPMVALRYE